MKIEFRIHEKLNRDKFIERECQFCPRVGDTVLIDQGGGEVSEVIYDVDASTVKITVRGQYSLEKPGQ